MVGGSLISSVYGNHESIDDEPLKVNGLIPNLVILSDSSETGRGSVENRGVLSSPFIWNKEETSPPPVYLEVSERLISSICYHKEINVTIVSQNEVRVHYFLKF